MATLVEKLVLGQDVINGFSLSFCQVLLAKLEELVKKDKVYIKGLKAARDGGLINIELTPIALTVLKHLDEQLRQDIKFSDINRLPVTEVDKLVAAAHEFVAMFENKKIDQLEVFHSGFGAKK